MPEPHSTAIADVVMRPALDSIASQSGASIDGPTVWQFPCATSAGT